MLQLKTELEGKRGYYGNLRDILKHFGLTIGGGWDYHKGQFDSVLARNEIEGETFYLRIPFHVLKGEMDKADAFIEFDTPYIIKHVINLGLDKEDNSLLSASGISQFQEPRDPDGQIKDKSKWAEIGEQVCEDILKVILHSDQQIS